ncbi:hypothetical protein [Geomicrobium sediminis]|uniref:Uncharacterized protein n=1 Tax=Geomicrobium sediminis TaxID=1347788 RepID=A0ABS2PHA1_9BACL|nr:hypothetical protein [Geomicrobium sediminis]MBM7634706.1 hypothetical protein [Geomicrobium sediminis]
MTSKQSLAIRTQTKEYSSWSLWYISIYLLIYIGINVVTYFTQGEITWTFIEGSFSSTTVFMLIVGLLSMGGFLNHYLSTGLTRRIYFRSVLFSGILVTVVIVIFTILLSFLIHGVLLATGWDQLYSDRIMENQSMFPSIVESLSYSASILLFFLIGWSISFGFYKHWVQGALYIALGVAITMITSHPLFESILPIYFTLFFIGFYVFLLHRGTRTLDVSP